MYFKILFIVVLFIAQISSVLSYGPLTKLLEDLFSNYDGGIRPNYGEKPVKVGVTAYILSIPNLDSDKMEFTVSMYLRQTWNDPRLQFKEIPGIGIKNSNDTIVLDTKRSSQIWVPDTFIVNEIRSFVHKLTIPNEFVRIKSDGSVLKSERVTLTASCPMDLQYFPMDSQYCVIEIESYGFTMSDIQYNWDKGLQSVGISADTSLPEFQVVGHRQQLHEISLSTGNYSRISLGIFFKRSAGKYVSRYYIPLTMFVSISLLALWVSRPEIGTIICFLNVIFTNLFVMMGLDGGIALISYVTVLDAYVTLCRIHIYICLIVSMLNLYFATNRKSQSMSMEMGLIRGERREATEDTENLCETQTTIPNLVPFYKYLAIARRFVEMICEHLRWILSIVFLFSLLVYWIHLIRPSAISITGDDFVELGY